LTTRSPRASKRILAAVAAAGIAATTFAITSPANAAQTVSESRVAGADRYATAAAVATATFPAGNNNIILASGENFPDGLAASGLAGFANAPVVLTTANALPAATAGAIATLDGLLAGQATVHIIGGEAAVGPAVRAQLTALGYNLNELSGADRYETSAAVAEFSETTFGSIGQFGGRRTAILATGTGFADALTAGAPAFAGKHPILLTAPNALPTSVSDALTAISAQQVIVLGGTAAVSDDVVTALQAKGLTVVRLGGANRYETAKLVADTVINPATFNFYGAPPQEVVLVSGENFADALAAGPHAGTIKAPMLLVQQCNIPAPTANFHVENNAVIDLVRAIGGTAAICDQVLTDAAAAATTVTPTATLAADQGRSSFTVEFSEAIVSSSVQITDFVVSSPARVVTPTAVTQALPVGATNTKWTVTLDAPLFAGDTVILTANSVQTPGAAPRFNALTSATVAPDTTRPTASIVTNAGASEFFVVFSEPMGASAAVATNYTSTGPAITGAALVAGTTSTYQVTTAAALAVNNVVGVTGTLVPAPGPSTGALDLAGNPVVTTTRTVVTDTVAPRMNTAALTTAATAQAQGNNAYVQFTAVVNGTADGAAGNAFSWTFEDVDALSVPTFSLNSTTGVITVRGDFVAVGVGTSVAPAISVANFTAAWNASPLSGSFRIDAIGGPTMITPAGITATGGLTVATVVVQFNEAVQGIANGDIGLFTSNSIGALAIGIGTTAPAVAIDGKVTLTSDPIGNPLAIPRAGTAVVNTSANVLTDFAVPANPNILQTLVTSAG
jgi:putative cell wall-binding protein